VRRVLLVKYGELALKGKNRPNFEKALVRNVRRALARADAQAGDAGAREGSVRRTGGSLEVRKTAGRLIVDVGEAGGEVRLSRLARAAARVFGTVGVAPSYRTGLDLEEITAAARAAAGEAVLSGRARTFKVEVKRPNKTFPLTSPEVARLVGAGVLEAVPGLSVDLHEPDFRVGVEIRSDGAYVYGSEIAGPGGLPVGTGGKAVALISGGIDSPVAIWMAMKRGLVTVPLHFWSYPFTSERARQKVVDLCRALSEWGPLPDLRVCAFTEVQAAIRDTCPEPLRVTVMRRMMVRIAAGLARREGAPALVTGESLGQVASQTLESLAVIEAVSERPILRPLIALDKEEIIERARAIGTYDISIQPYEDCCTLFVPPHPRTRPSLEEAEKAEEGLDVEGLVARTVKGIEAVRTAKGL